MAECIYINKGTVSYPKVTFLGRRIKASRRIWELLNGDIPKGMNILHKCDDPRCVNPDHLFMGTQKDNMQDCAAKKRHQNNKSHCIRGHEFNIDNTYVSKVGKRSCRECHNAWKRAYNG